LCSSFGFSRLQSSRFPVSFPFRVGVPVGLLDFGFP